MLRCPCRALVSLVLDSQEASRGHRSMSTQEPIVDARCFAAAYIATMPGRVKAAEAVAYVL